MDIQELCKNMIGKTNNFGTLDVERGAILRHLLKEGLI